MSEFDYHFTETSEAIEKYLAESLNTCLAGGFIVESDKALILRYLNEKTVCAIGALNTSIYASQSRTSFIYFLLNQARDFMDKTEIEL